jgi:hypothetical protein
MRFLRDVKEEKNGRAILRWNGAFLMLFGPLFSAVSLSEGDYLLGLSMGVGLFIVGFLARRQAQRPPSLIRRAS